MTNQTLVSTAVHWTLNGSGSVHILIHAFRLFRRILVLLSDTEH